ncbi:unnamed protein product [Rangifer tarandus platyrhynchus]|uniref:Uncharacterized protein n=1 Tax=Rangifer tarandus platyrhynchus TaxID=3082113 RepID=A0ABN8ZE49_RANTA|nr:unnamed protein product [Rangifer tarandus platyrhynchus]CAI9688853.1 unnamed protein product [Rangifer tarandus platyrhynchus]
MGRPVAGSRAVRANKGGIWRSGWPNPALLTEQRPTAVRGPPRLFWSLLALALDGQVGSRLARRGERSHGHSGGLVSGQDLPSVLCQADVTKREARHRAQGLATLAPNNAVLSIWELLCTQCACRRLLLSTTAPRGGDCVTVMEGMRGGYLQKFGQDQCAVMQPDHGQPLGQVSTFSIIFPLIRDSKMAERQPQALPLTSKGKPRLGRKPAAVGLLGSVVIQPLRAPLWTVPEEGSGTREKHTELRKSSFGCESQTDALAFLEALVAMVTEAVPIAGVVFVVRVPVLDKESEAKPTAAILPLFQGLDIVNSGLRRFHRRSDIKEHAINNGHLED